MLSKNTVNTGAFATKGKTHIINAVVFGFRGSNNIGIYGVSCSQDSNITKTQPIQRFSWHKNNEKTMITSCGMQVESILNHCYVWIVWEGLNWVIESFVGPMLLPRWAFVEIIYDGIN